MTRNILLFGDSNTYGTVPMVDWNDARRHSPSVRWPGIAQLNLGPDWRLIEEGLPGRTSVHDDPIEGEDRNGRRMLLGLIASHRPLDAVVIMLGTNDFKSRFSLTAEDVAGGLGVLAGMVRTSASPGMVPPKVLLVSPPPIRAVGCLTPFFTGGHEKSRRLAPLLAAVARANGAHFLDAGTVCEMSPVEGIHMEAEAHKHLGLAIAAELRAMF
ncbi:hypothetical protein HDIA_4345 [Hartmannibacter diazotrophicus]|uniref:SGNH hydrolase-type esterase domain-containing protein n=1 Tax=Hartmannibacter diazotrophicus TaxID=1482074 RepID=A0A2C9DCA1_9HYPH|nr:SGNH/GDSL hydrolase family protein [Hartmannibacter diazotrophicus]SON57886.1 hypothetical protein HDIA_4345 [Hartmannibacter diazotrophicus]